MSSTRNKDLLGKVEQRGPFEVRDAQAAAVANAPVRSTVRNSTFIDDDEDDSGGDTLEPPRRRYDCAKYDQCLDLAAALNWSSFTCGDCRGQINEALYWRAGQIRRKDSVARALCELPPIVKVQCAKTSESESVCTPHPSVVEPSDIHSTAENCDSGLVSEPANVDDSD